MDPFGTQKHLVMGPGWAGFTDSAHWIRYGTVLIAATVSGAVLAYHPAHTRGTVTLADIEQRKTLIIYSIAGALIAVVCAVNPSMAFVIFGIGGLLRFRTDVGESKSTGHTIIATLVGLCWGLGLELVAVLATAYFWSIVWFLEKTQVERLRVGGIASADLARAAEVYRQTLTRAGCRIYGHEKSHKALEMTFIVRMKDRSARDLLAKEFDSIPEPLRGVPEWTE